MMRRTAMTSALRWSLCARRRWRRPRTHPSRRPSPLSVRRSISCRSPRWSGTSAAGSPVISGKRTSSFRRRGARRDIIDFRSDENAPIRVALLFDVSGSMRLSGRLEEARQAARHLLSAMRLSDAFDEAAVFSFDMNLQSLQPFTADAGAIESAIARVQPYGQTSSVRRDRGYRARRGRHEAGRSASQGSRGVHRRPRHQQPDEA